MHIETAQGTDWRTVLALVDELLLELGAEGAEFAGVDRGRLEAALEKEGAAPTARARFLALLARDGASDGGGGGGGGGHDRGEAVGVLTLSLAFAIYAGGEYGVIDEMYVRPAWRGQGIGKALVERAAALARERGWHRIDVTTPEEDHERSAAEFYRGRGFEFTGSKLRLLLER